MDFSEEDSSSHSNNSSGNSSNSEESEIIPRSKSTRQRPLLAEIKENPDLYATRRSERNRKEPTRLNIENIDKSSRLRRIYSGSSSQDENDDDNDSDYEFVRTASRRRDKNKQPKMEFRKRAHVSYKEAESSDQNDSDDESSIPNKKRKSNNNNAIYPNNASSMRDNPLVNRPATLLRRLEVDQNDEGSNGVILEFNTEQDDSNVIEDVLNFRLSVPDNTGPDTTYYNQKLKGSTFEEGTEKQFLIKWRGWSHIHSTWESENSLKTYINLDGLKKLHKFREIQKHRDYWKKYEASPEDLDAIQFEEERNESMLQEKMECERIIDDCPNETTGDIDYLIKWKTLDYRYSTWESGEEIVKKLYPEAISDYEERNTTSKVPNKKSDVWTRRPKFIPIREQPDYLSMNSNLKLRDYQLDGINWMARSWTRGNSAILADEMGLGKTIQTIGFLSYLFNQHNMFGPFLLVVPLSTIGSWQTELSNWAPYMNVVVYTGDSISRQVIRECEWYFKNKKKSLKFHVCITTYELLLKDKVWLNQISWAFLGIDEAHRLKNDESQLYAALISFNTNTRLLVTGTPVHNSLRELWALLHFIMPDKFDKWQDFEDRYNISNENSAVGEVISQLYRVLEPFLLRRTKKDVEKSLPSKSEQIIRVPMCKKQAELYKMILTKNYEALSKETRGHTSSFLNVVMELKKCCNHVQLVNPIDEETEHAMSHDERLRYLTKSSGKMTLLDKLLFEMKQTGHRVLIFSQMVRMLDIISDYLLLRGWGFQRLDGSIKGSVRKQAIDHFNAEGSTDFCFLLSTRAGGLGINLATADTVVIFDSDWNPQNDLQAMARAHRIGQRRQVSIYRFVIRNSVEEKIVECAKRKMVLDHLVIQRMDARPGNTHTGSQQPFNKEELNEILKFGAADLFNEHNEVNDEEEDMNIHDILQRAETQDDDYEDQENNPARDLLSAFKVVNIHEAPEDEEIVYIGHKGKATTGKTWSEIVPQALREKVQEEERQKALLDLDLGPRQRSKVKSYQVGEGGNEKDESNSSSSEDGVGNSRESSRFSEKEMRAIVRCMKKFPRPLERVEAVMIEAELLEHDQTAVLQFMSRVIETCRASDKKIVNIGKVNIPAKILLQSLYFLDILHVVLPSTSQKDRLLYRLPFSTKLANWSCDWDAIDDARLLVGVYERGMDNWEAIKMDPELSLTSKILPNNSTDRPQSSHLKTRVEYLLKKLCDHHNHPSSVPVIATTKKINPKSAEFVEESDDSSKGSTKKTKLKSKSKPKSSTASSSNKVKGNGDKSKSIKSNTDKKDLDSDEISFYKMRGPLFEKCTKKMKPIKRELKFLEDLQSKNNSIKTEDSALCQCLLSIGNHIRSLINEYSEDEKRRWRNYLWMFVNFFFDVFPKEELHRIYKKKLTEDKKKGKDNKTDNRTSENKHKSHQSSYVNKNRDNQKCNFEAKSYQEYRNRMKTTSGESSKEKNVLKHEKTKPYYRYSESNVDKYDKSYNSNYHDNKYNKSFDNNSNNYQKDYKSHKPHSNYHSNNQDDPYHSKKYTRYEQDMKFNKDPRLSKSNIN